jgi:hypothetical protein
LLRSLRKLGLLAVVAVMISVFAASSASAASAYYGVDWSSFPNLPEDRVSVTEVTNQVAPTHIYLELESAPYITWWKALDAHGWNDHNVGWVETKNANHGPNGMVLRLDDVQDVILAKGGWWGLYKGMYRLDHDTLKAKAGSKITFRWQAD